MMTLKRAIFVLAGICLLFSSSQGKEKRRVDEIPPMPKLKTFHLEVPIAHDGTPDCIIATPAGKDYAALGQRLAEAIHKTAGVNVPVRSGAQLSADMAGQTNAILLGYFANNPLVERIYCEYLIDADSLWPGSGGYTIRTVHDPLGKGTSFVYLGGCDVASTAKAVNDFITTLPKQRKLAYPHTVKVVLPDGTTGYQPHPARIAKAIQAVRGKDFRACGGALCSAGLRYYRLGDRDELEVFKGIAPFFRETIRKLGVINDTRGAIYLINIWDAIEEAPQFSPQDRQDITAIMWEFTQRFMYIGKVVRDQPTPEGNDWNSRVACDLARYWKKYYDLDVGGLFTWANVRSQSQAKFWRSRENCPGYGGMTMYDALYYVVPYQYETYWKNGTGRKMADYGMAIINNLGGIAGFGDTSDMGGASYWPDLFRVAAWKLKDGRYLYAEQHTSGANRNSDNFFHCNFLQKEIAPVRPDDILGVHVVPLPDWVWQHRNSVLATAPPAMNPVLDAAPLPPREQCFDKITFRTTMDPDRQYLILGGPSHGYHSHPDGNSIIEFTDRSRYCLFDSGYFVPDTIEHNTLVVYRDGLFEPVPRLTGLAAMGDFAGLGMTQTYLNGYNGVNWRRNIVWSKEKYFLVLDEVEAVKPGNYGLLAVFRTLSDKKPEVDRDRVRALHRGSRFNLVSASHTPFKVTGTTPPASDRHALVETKTATLRAGDRQYFANLLYSTGNRAGWPYEIVPAAANAVMIRSPEGYALAGTGNSRPLPAVRVDAAVFHVAPDGFTLTAARSFSAGDIAFHASVPVNIEVKLARPATGTIQCKTKSTVGLRAQGDTVELDSKPIAARRGSGGLEFDVPAGTHTLKFTPLADKIDAGSWEAAYASLKEQHLKKLSQLGKPDVRGRRLQAAWKLDNSETRSETVYVGRQGNLVEDLTKTGKAKCWTAAQRGAHPAAAVDGDPATYTATSSGASWSRDLPKDIGMEWSSPVKVGCFQVDYHGASYAPAKDGHQLQAWNGNDWYPVKATIRTDSSGANWTYEFPPVETARVRVLITRFSVQRTAVREMRVFAEAAEARQRAVRIPLRAHSLAAFDVDGDGKAEVLVAAGNQVQCVKGNGTVSWRRTLGGKALCVSAADLDGDGRGEVVAGSADQKLYCFDDRGNPRWSIECPPGANMPGTEPRSGAVEVVKCGDVNGDGKGEIIAGSGNWFAYAFDKDGKLLWKALNWAHHPTSIALAHLPGGKRAAVIGTTYCSANVFSPDGKQIASVDVGYHGAAMSAAAGDMDGNGKDELVVGSRIGGLHGQELGSKNAWTMFMGAEVTGVAMVDLTGDGRRAVVAGSKNHYLLAADARGRILWNCNLGESILDLAAADGRRGAIAEIAAATEGGMLHLVGGDGKARASLDLGAPVIKVVAGDFGGTGKIGFAAATEDGFLFGVGEIK